MARFRIVVALAGAVALGVLTPALVTLVRHGGAERFVGWTDAARGSVWIVDSVDAAGPAAARLQVGDRLLSVDGDTLVARYGARYFRSTAPIGGRYSVRVERNGRTLGYTLTVAAGRSRLAERLVYFFISLVWCAVGLFIGYARPDDTVARLAFGAGVATGISYLQLGVFSGSLPSSLYQPLHMVLGYHFFHRFPGGVRRGKLATAALAFVYASGVAVCAVKQPLNWTFFVHGPGATAAWVEGHATLLRARRVFGEALVLLLVIGSVTLIWKAYRRASGDQRRRIRWVVHASLAGLSPLLLWGVLALIRAASPGKSPIPPRVWLAVDLATNAGTVLIPIGVAYAVVRHRVFDISVVVRRTLQYVLARRALQVLLALPSAALVVNALSDRNRTIAQLLDDSASYVWLIAVAAVALRFRQPLGRWLDRRFFREQYDREQVLVGLLGDLRRLTEPADVSRLVRAQVDYALHPSVTQMWFDGDPDPPPEPLLSSIARRGGGPDAPMTSGDELPHGISVVVPLTSSEERLVGVMMLGEKRSEEPYSPGDLSLLGGIAKEAVVVRENLLLRERISEEHRIRADVLAHLGPDRVSLLRECPTCGSCYDSEADRCTRDGQPLTLSLPVSRTVAGRYRLDALIGRGGMGAVYEALDLRLDRTVAVKFLLGHGLHHEHALRRFRREARAVARLDHPNVVTVYDYGGLDTHGAYLVMERIRGVTLREELEWRGALSGLEAAAWFSPMLDGLAAAHEEGIVHRDLKPENVVRTRPEFGPPVVKILDFGVAKVRPIDTIGDRLTVTGTVVGTLGYMSPEQLTGHEVDARSDLFAVGVMVVEALTGRWPFQGATYGELLGAIVLEPYHLPEVQGAKLQVLALDMVLRRCLAKEPGGRFDGASELRHELVPALRECPTLAPMPTVRSPP